MIECSLRCRGDEFITPACMYLSSFFPLLNFKL